MKVVCLLGSPRPKGNSATVATKFMETAESLGAQTQTFLLNKLDYKGCQACYACKTKREDCALDDGLKPVLDAVKDCDILVMATPIYYGEVSSQTKAFIDRTFSYVKPDFLTNPVPARLAPGKKSVWIMAQQSAEAEQFTDVFPRYDFFFKMYGFENHLIRALGVNQPGEVSAKEDVMSQAESLAKQLVGS
jgi:multimeric flavodoxin WrbA